MAARERDALRPHRPDPPTHRGGTVIERTPAERLDRALDALLAATSASPPVDPQLRPLIGTADRVRMALAPIPVAPRFETRLGHKLASRPHGWRPPRDRLHLPGWLLLTGAVSSAAVGVGVTAYAVWRGSRRGSLPGLGGR
jgi:hypothetical protein